MDGRRVAARRRHVSCCVDMAPSWAPPKSDDAHDDATLVLMPFASSLDGWRLCGRALWAGLCPSCPVGTPARSQPSEEHSQTCSECRHTFCRSHRANPRCRTRCAACRGFGVPALRGAPARRGSPELLPVLRALLLELRALRVPRPLPPVDAQWHPPVDVLRLLRGRANRLHARESGTGPSSSLDVLTASLRFYLQLAACGAARSRLT